MKNNMFLLAALSPAVVVFAQQPAINRGMETSIEATLSMPKVVRVLLNEDKVVLIPTNKGVTTTVRFPGIIEDVMGAGYTKDPQQVAGDFIFKWKSGTNYISLCPVAENARRNLNVVYDGKVYTLDCFPSDRNHACPSVVCETETSMQQRIFVADHSRVREGGTRASADVRGGDNQKEVEKSFAPPAKPLISAGAGRLLGVIDTIKLLLGLDPSIRKLALEQMPNNILSLRDEITRTQNYELKVQAVLRNNVLDALVFAVGVKNLTSDHLMLNPETFIARTGTENLRAVLSDIAPDVPPGGETVGYFVVIGNGEGSPNWLSPDNKWTCSLDYLGQRVADEPVLSKPNRENDPVAPKGNSVVEVIDPREAEKAEKQLVSKLTNEDGVSVQVLTPQDIELENKQTEKSLPAQNRFEVSEPQPHYKIEVLTPEQSLVAVLGSENNDDTTEPQK